MHLVSLYFSGIRAIIEGMTNGGKGDITMQLTIILEVLETALNKTRVEMAACAAEVSHFQTGV